ncbi:MAG TPA: FAD-dependent thymidylate synthase [Desulfobulbus sp.]|nr:FAD-dependent thymidylate synthase [Desulfobulbus sp.]
MKIIPPSFTVLDQLDQESLPVRIEYCGRVCYKSEDRIDRESAIPFVARMAEHGHNSVLEMGVLTLEVECPGQEPVDELFRCQPKYLFIDIPEENRLLVTGSVRAFREMLLFHPDSALVQAMSDFLLRRHDWFFTGIRPQSGPAPVPTIRVDKIALEEVDRFPAPLLERHRHIAVKFVVNRAVTHEIVRHRPCSFLQESQRYCRYSDDKFGSEVTFIRPLFFAEGSVEYNIWQQAMRETEKMYLQLLETCTPQAARTVLPNSCKTELIVYCNLAEWKHIFRLRTSKAAEPSMREVMIPLQEDFRERFPGVFQ